MIFTDDRAAILATINRIARNLSISDCGGTAPSKHARKLVENTIRFARCAFDRCELELIWRGEGIEVARPSLYDNTNEETLAGFPVFRGDCNFVIAGRVEIAIAEAIENA
jgi:hypothetical protein